MYKKRYLEYKSKYLDLKHNQKGGAYIDDNHNSKSQNVIDQNAGYLCDGVPAAFPVCQWNKVESHEIRPDLSITLYRFPNDRAVDVLWWQTQVELLYLIDTCMKAKQYCELVASSNKCTDTSRYLHLLALNITKMFSKNAYSPVGALMVCSDACMIRAAVDILNDKSVLAYIDNVVLAYRETIQEYSDFNGLKDTLDRFKDQYLVTLHPPNKPEYVFMTMRVRVNYGSNPLLVEHRHIQQNFFARVAPYIDKTYPPIPRNISILMHQETAKIILKIYPQITTIYVNPLYSMAKILQDNGYGKFDFSEEKLSYTWWYDYRALAQGKKLEDLLKEFTELIKKLGFEVTDFKGSSVNETLDVVKQEGIRPELVRSLAPVLGLSDL